MPKPRRVYLEALLRFRDTDLIKVVTGVRRCGKSTLLQLAQEEIARTAPAESGFVALNLESMADPIITHSRELYEAVRARLATNARTYIFIDEPQRIEGWEDAVNAMRVDFDCDIYITGSNAYLLSSELATYLSGRYVEIPMLPLSVAEYAEFCGLSYAPKSSVALDAEGKPVIFDDLLMRYLQYGGMPALANLQVTQAEHSAYITSLYDAIVVRDIVNRERGTGGRAVTNEIVLRKLAAFLADNVGSSISANKVANTLISEGIGTNYHTIDSYMEALAEAYVFYPVERYDIKGRALLRNGRKRYIVDLGFRAMLDGYRASDIGRVFENAVYLELLYRGYAVRVGKHYGREVDFVATKDAQRIYIQATDEMYAQTTRERELAPLQAIRDAYSRMVVVRQGTYERDVDGIRIVSAREFFLEDWG